MSRAYLLALGLGTLLCTVAIAAINYVVDPFLFNGRVLHAGFNAERRGMVRYVRLAKATRITEVDPAAIALGSSRVDHGIDMSAPAWPAALQPRYNLGIPGGGVDAMHAYFQHAAASPRLRLVVLGLEFNMFNARLTSLDSDRDFDPRVLQAPDHVAWPWRARALAEAYVSLDTLQASLRTVRSQRQGRNEYDLSGRFTDAFYLRRARCEGGFRPVFAKVEAAFIEGNRPGPQGPSLSWTYPDGRTSFEVFAALLRDARRAGVDLRLYISPGHLEEMRMQRVLGTAGALPDWKRRLVEVVEAEGRESRRPPFPLWDFSHVRGVIDEPVPPLEDTTQAMRWYWDHSHFSPAMGRRILARVLEHPGDGDNDSFGVRLGAANVEQVIQAQAQWASAVAVDPIALGPDLPRVRATARPRLADCSTDGR